MDTKQLRNKLRAKITAKRKERLPSCRDADPEVVSDFHKKCENMSKTEKQKMLNKMTTLLNNMTN